MNIRLSRFATSLLFVVAVLLMSGRSWAVYNGLGPSNDDWKMNYDVEVNPAEGDTLNVVFTLADDGRLKPIYSIELIALSRQTDSQGGHSYDVKARLEFKQTQDGKRVAEARIRKEFADRAVFRILTLTVDGRRQTSGAAFYDIPLNKFLRHAPAAASRQTPRSKSIR